MYDFAVDKESKIVDLAKTLAQVDYSIADLKNVKEELSKQLAALLEHREEGQTTYKHGRYKIECKSGKIFKLDKEEYEIMKSKFTPGLDPVRTKIAYEVDREALRKLEVYGSEEDIKLAEELITVSPSKISVKVRAAS